MFRCRTGHVFAWAGTQVLELPNTHRLGMLRSSTWTTNCFPAGGPKTPFLRFSIFASIISWVMFADVCAEKVMVKGDTEESTHLFTEQRGSVGEG